MLSVLYWILKTALKHFLVGVRGSYVFYFPPKLLVASTVSSRLQWTPLSSLLGKHFFFSIKENTHSIQHKHPPPSVTVHNDLKLDTDLPLLVSKVCWSSTPEPTSFSLLLTPYQSYSFLIGVVVVKVAIMILIRKMYWTSIMCDAIHMHCLNESHNH